MTTDETLAERIRTFFHHDKLINYFDYRGLTDEAAIVEAIRNATTFLIQQNKRTLQLSNVTGVSITRGLVEPVMGEMEKFEPYILRDAIVGVAGAKRILFHTYLSFFGNRTRAFDDEASALDWLVSP